MKLYFQTDSGLNSGECGVKINGEFAGFAGFAPSFTEAEEDCLVELLPGRGENYCPVSFRLSDEVLKKPPETLTVTDLGGHYMVSPRFVAVPPGKSRIILQEKGETNAGEALATLYQDGSTKISVDCGGRFNMENVCELVQPRITFHDAGRDSFMMLTGYRGLKRATYVYHLGEQIKKVFQNSAATCSFNDGFNTVVEFKDIARHRAEIEWDFIDGGFKKRSYHLKKRDNFDFKALKRELLPYAFFEEVFCRGDFADLLSPALRRGADRLTDYLGDFCAVMPPPHFRRQCETGLVYRKSDNFYYVKWYNLEFEDGLVSNIFCD